MISLYATVDRRQIWQQMPRCHILLPASAWRTDDKSRLVTPQLPAVAMPAADSGAYRALVERGYSFSTDDYVMWLDTFAPKWAATRDHVCAFADEQTVIERQQMTSENAWLAYQDYRDVTWSWTPVIQGWTIAEYQQHAREMRPLLADMRRIGHAYRVGIGTLKVRKSALEISRIVQAIADILPTARFHLFGIGLGVLKQKEAYFPQTISIDTSLWDGRCGLKARHFARREQFELGMTRKEYGYTVALPRYQDKINRALSQTKQLSLLI